MLRPGEEECRGGEEPAPVGSPVIERRSRRFGTVFCRRRSTVRWPREEGGWVASLEEEHAGAGLMVEDDGVCRGEREGLG